MMTTAFVSALLIFAAGQDPDAVSQRDIDRAIRQGVEHLMTAPSGADFLSPNCDELILLAMVAAEVSEANPVFSRYLKACLSSPLEKTYKVACLAMALEELDPSEHQMKIAQCAQFLVDNQAKNGQWSYGSPTDLKKFAFEEKPEKKVATGPKASEARVFTGGRERKKPARSIAVAQTRYVLESGDNSNSQYAALGLRACYEANIKLPPEVLQLARRWWVESQWPDESDKEVGKNAVVSGGSKAKCQGWSYQKPGGDEKAPTHSMTAGAIGATVIYEHLLGRSWKKDAVTQAGVAWLGKNFTVSENLYYMYAVERAGMLYDTPKFGDHDWYVLGSKYLVRSQNPNGSWGQDAKPEVNTWGTCFAILFLKKATRSIITGDRR
jgi:hypothetical protein